MKLYFAVREIKAEVDSRNEQATATQLAHIFSESTNFSIDPNRRGNTNSNTLPEWGIERSLNSP